MLSLLSLYHNGHKIYGGNLLSVFCGEFCFAIANSLLLIYLANLYRGIETGKHIVLNAIMLATLALTHMVTFVVALFTTIFFLFSKDFKGNFCYLFKSHFLAFLLTSFWSVPMVLKLGYTAEMINDAKWWLNIGNIHILFPKILIPLYLITLLYLLIRIFKPEKASPQILLFIFGIIVSSFFYFHGWLGWQGRFHPINGILITVVSTLIIAEIAKKKYCNTPFLYNNFSW